MMTEAIQNKDNSEKELLPEADLEKPAWEMSASENPSEELAAAKNPSIRGILKHADKVRPKSLVPNEKKPIAKQCSFQRHQEQYERPSTHAAHRPQQHEQSEATHKKKTLAETLPELMAKFKKELGCKNFIVKTKQAVELRKRVERAERPWIKGNEMQAFYHTWQTSEDHIKDQRVRPSTVRRMRSLPKDFKVSESAVEGNKPKSATARSGFGIVRQCCSHPRTRIPTFLDHDHDHDHHV